MFIEIDFKKQLECIITDCGMNAIQSLSHTYVPLRDRMRNATVKEFRYLNVHFT